MAGYEHIMPDILDGLRDGTITDFIIIANKKVVGKEAQEREGAANLLPNYWFGDDSCVRLIGMLEYMKQQILDYIRSVEEFY